LRWTEALVNAFNATRKLLAENAIKKTLRFIAANYAHATNFVNDFALRWEAHFPSGQA
jgi:hypothetical protein